MATVHEVADRHAALHDREFARTYEVAVPHDNAALAATAALKAAGLEDAHGKIIVTLEWPHE